MNNAPQKITVVTSTSAIEKIAYWFGLSLAGLMFYGGITLIGECNTNSIYERNESGIKLLIQAGKLDQAKKALEEYADLPEGKIRIGDRLLLEELLDNEAKKKECTDELEKAMTDKNYSLTKEKIEQAKSLGINTATYERTLNMSTEEGFLELINNAKGAAKLDLIQGYFSFYPKGSSRKDVIKMLLVEDLRKSYSLLDNFPILHSSEIFSKLFSSVNKINSDLEKYSGEQVSLVGIVSPEDVTTKIETVLNKALLEEQSATNSAGVGLVQGCLVKSIPTTHEHYNQDYFSVRKAAIPTGLVGKIIKQYGGNHEWYLVEFDDSQINKAGWTRFWPQDSSNWKDGKKNVGSYLAEELQPYKEPINEVDKNLLKSEIQKMKQLLRNYSEE